MQSAIDKIMSVSCSGKFTAILDCLLDQPRRTDPAIEIMTIVDGCLLAQHFGDCGYNDFMGSEWDLLSNMHGLAEVAELTEEELFWFLNQEVRLRYNH